MKGFFAKTFSGRSITFWWIPLSFVAATRLANAAALQEARVSQVIQDVRLLEAHGAPRPAVVNDKLTLERAVRTGVQSRAELTFTDLTITRLGANTIFSLKAGAREVDLTSGTILLAVPTGRPPVKANTTSVTVAVTGGTALLATGPPLKFLVLEGTGTIYPKGHPEKAVTVNGGEMALMTMGGQISQPEQFDVKLVLETSALIVDFPPLANLPLILTVVNQQLAAQQLAGATNQPLAKNLIDVVDVTDQNANANPVVLVSTSTSSPTTPPPTPTTPPPTPTTPPPTPTTPPPTPTTPPPTPTTPPPTPTTPPPTPTTPPPTPTTPPPTPTTPPPTPTTPPPTPTTPPPTPTTPPPTPTTPPPTPTPSPSKTGTPNVIASPNPYVITSGTTITTDPSITTNGVTNYGTIYRGPVDDGAFSLWAFGSTSAVDTALGIDNFFADPSHFPIAAFKFQSLSLNGNPTIDLSNGGVTKLALIGVDGITSGPPGGTLTFTGLDLLALATVNGPITLTSDVSFQNLNELAMYARGAGSDLTIDSPITNIGILELAAEGSIQLTNPGTMSVGEFDAITGGGDLTLELGASLLLNGKVRLDAIVLPGATVASGANLTLNVTGDYTNSSATEFSRLAITNQGHIGTGGNISLSIGGNLTATGLGSATAFLEPGDVELLVQNTNAQIDNGGNLNLTVGGNVNVNGLALYVQNYDQTANPAGHIGTGGNIDVEIGGNLTANSYVDVFLNNRGGGMIDSGGNLTFNVGGALNIGADAGGTGSPGFSAEFIISTRYDEIGGNTTPSTIGSDVSLYFHAASVDMAGALFGSGISNRGGSIINGNATATWDVPGAVNIQGTVNLGQGSAGADWFILNDIPPDHQFTPPSGGTIHGTATLTLNIGGDLTIAGDGAIYIANQRNFQEQGSSGGTIDSDATLNITTANFSTGGELDVYINNRNDGSGSGTGGSIGGNAAINLNLSGNLTAPGSDPNTLGTPGLASIGIFNEGFVAGSPGGFIGGDATITASAINISTANDLDVEIANQGGGHIGGNASINFNLTGDLTTQANANFTIDNSNGGTIDGAANVAVNIDNNVTVTGPNGISLNILNNSGHIVTGANVLYSVGGSTSTTGLGEFIDNTNGGVIDNGGNVTLNTIGPVMLDGGFSLEVDNFNGGTINTGANVTAHFVGDATATVGSGHSFNWYVLNGSGFFNPTATGGTIETGGNINVTFDGNASTTGTSTTGAIAAEIQNGSGGSIGTGGNISVIVGGNLNAGPLFLITENQGGFIGTGGNNTLNVSGDITTQGDAQFQIFNQDNGNGPGTIGLDATINVNATNITTGGSLFDAIYNYSGGNIVGNATINLSVGGNLTTSQNGTFDLHIENSNGGHIGGDSSILASITGNLDTADFNVGIQDHDGGIITGGGNVTLDVGGNLTNAENTHPLFLFVNTFSGGFIDNGGNVIASVAGDVSAGNIGPAIQNQGGTINTGGNLSFSVGGNLTTAQNTDSFFGVDNFDGGVIGTGGNTMVSVGGSISTHNLIAGFDNHNGGMINSGGNVNLTVTGNLTTAPDGSLNLFVTNNGLGQIGAGGNIVASVGQLVNTGDINIGVQDYDSGVINTGGNINFTVGGSLTAQNLSAYVNTFNSGAIDTGGNVFVAVNGDVSVNSIFMGNQNQNGGSINNGDNVTLNFGGNVNATGSVFAINTLSGGQIGAGANIVTTVVGDLSADTVVLGTNNNDGGIIGTGGNVTLTVGGNLTTTNDVTVDIQNYNAGAINSDGNVSLSVGGNLTAGNLNVFINNTSGGTIGGNAEMNVTTGGLTGNSINVNIDNHDSGVIDLNAAVNVNVATISTTGGFNASLGSFGTQGGGQIGGNASINVLASSGITAGADVSFDLGNNHGSGTPAGSIGGSATIDVAVTGGDISAGGFVHGTIDNQGSTIGGDAAISLDVSGAISSQNNAFFTIIFNDDNGSGPGMIAGNATIDVNAGSISIGGNDLFHSTIFNEGGGTIGGNAAINFNMSSDITTPGDIIFNLSNSGGTIGLDAGINVAAANITANSLLAQVDNTGGSIGGNATINMNVSGAATVTNDATVAMYGSDAAASAAINFDGGSYDAGGTFSVFTDGNGTITFNNASLHADVLKIGALGTNGVLNIGGGTLSADTTLKLYGGSNGTINFKADVTLGGNAATKILAANSITIFNNVTVTIGGSTPADVYTTNANYSALFGGNGSTTGTFAGAGANNPQPLSSAPAFDDPPPPAGVTTTSTSTRTTAAKGPTLYTTSGTTTTTIKSPTLSTAGGTRSTRIASTTLSSPKATSTKTGGAAINVSNTDQLLSLLDGAAAGSDGKITISNSKSGNSNSKNTSSNSTNLGRINASGVLHAHRQMMDIRQMRDRSVMNSRLGGGARPQ